MYWFVIVFLSLLFAYCGGRNNVLVRNEIMQNFFRLMLVTILSYNIAFSGANYQDHEGYKLFFYSSINYDFSIADINGIFAQREFGMEFGYLLLNKLFYNLGFGAVGFFFVIAFITNSLFISVVYRFRYPVFCILAFITSGFYYQEGNLVRQMLAIAMFLYSIKWLRTDKMGSTLKYVLLILCATLIHTSAFLLLLFVLFRYLKVRKCIQTLNIILFLFWSLSVLIKLGLFNFSTAIELFSFLTFYQNYLTTTNSVGLEDLSRYAYLYDLCLLIYFICEDKQKVENYQYKFFFVLGGILANIATQLPNVYRFSLYFIGLQSLILSLFIIENIKQKYEQIANISFSILCCFYLSRVFVFIIEDSYPIVYKLNDFFR